MLGNIKWHPWHVHKVDGDQLFASTGSPAPEGRKGENPLPGLASSSGFQKERFGVQAATHTDQLTRASRNHQGRPLVPRTTATIKQSLLLALVWRQCWVKQNTSFLEARADCIAEMVEEMLANKYITPKGLSKQPIKIQNPFLCTEVPLIQYVSSKEILIF